MLDEDAVEEAFGRGFQDGALVEVGPVTFATVPLPAEAKSWPCYAKVLLNRTSWNTFVFSWTTA